VSRVIVDDAGVSHALLSWVPDAVYPRCTHGTDSYTSGVLGTTWHEVTNGVVDCMACLGFPVRVAKSLGKRHLALAWGPDYIEQCVLINSTPSRPRPVAWGATEGTLDEVDCLVCRELAGLNR